MGISTGTYEFVTFSKSLYRPGTPYNILLYHEKGGDKEIIPLDASHKQKRVKLNARITSEASDECIQTNHKSCIPPMQHRVRSTSAAWVVCMTSDECFTSFCLWDKSSGIISLSPTFEWYNSIIVFFPVKSTKIEQNRAKFTRP